VLNSTQAQIAAVIGYEPLTRADGDQPYPVETCFNPLSLRNATKHDEAPCVGWPMVKYRGDWYAAPSMEQVEEWTFDSICETPDGDEVEPDASGSWLYLLGLI
jgi:hypothetical protein